MATNIASSTSHCGFCNNTGKLLRCSRCKVILYCNREHQAAHRASHKSACNDIAKCRDNVNIEEQKLRDHPGDMMTPPDVFESSVGHFWGIYGTRDYMRARYALVEAARKVKTHDAVQAQYDDLMDLLRLCRSDNMGVRFMLPAVMLRLDKDQECYDFVKWWHKVNQQSDYDWGNMDLPYLDIKNADPLEPVKHICGKFPNLSHVVAITLLKVKLLLDLRMLRDSDVLGSKVPREILDRIQSQVPRSPIIAGDKNILECRNYTTAIDELTAQVHTLYELIKKTNTHFWPSLMSPGDHLRARPGAYSVGTIQEMRIFLQYSYDSWAETAGALELIKAKMEED